MLFSIVSTGMTFSSIPHFFFFFFFCLAVLAKEWGENYALARYATSGPGVSGPLTGIWEARTASLHSITHIRCVFLNVNSQCRCPSWPQAVTKLLC